MASTHARSGTFHKDESDNDYDHSHEDTSDSNEEFASASEGDDDLPWEPVVIRSPAISRASPIVPSQTPIVHRASPKDTQQQQPQQQQQQHHHHHLQQETRVYSHQSHSASIHHQKQDAPEDHYRQEHHSSHGHFNQNSGSSTGGHAFSPQNHYHTQSQSYHHSSSSSSLSQVSPSQTISRGMPKLRERMRQSPVPYSKIVQAYLDPTTQLQSPEHVRMAWLQDQQETRHDSSDDDEDTLESKIHTLQTHSTAHQTRTHQSQIRPQPISERQDLHPSDASKIHHTSTSVDSQSVYAIAPHRNPPASSYLTTRTHTTETTQTAEKTSLINVPMDSEERESGWGFDDEDIQEGMTENNVEAQSESVEVITVQHPTENNHPGFEAPKAISISLDETIADDPEASWGFDEDISLPAESHLSPLAQDAIVSQENTYPHIHNIHEADGADDGWGYDDQGIEIAESAIQPELVENAQEHIDTTHTWNDTAGQSISVEEDAWGNDLQEVNISGVPTEDVQVPAQPPIYTSVSTTFGLAQTGLGVEDDAWGDDSQNIDIGLDNNLDIPNEAPQEELLEDAWAHDNNLDITTQDTSGEHLESFPVGAVTLESHQLKVTQRSSITSEGTVNETSWGFNTDDTPETPLHEHVQHSAEEQHRHSNLSAQHVSTHFQADGSHLSQQEHVTLSTSFEPDVHFDNHTSMDSKGQAELVIGGFDDIEENAGDAWGYDEPVVEAHEPIAEPTETAPVDPIPLEPIHEVAQSSIEEAAQTDDAFEDHCHDSRDHISNGSDNEHDNEVREVLLAAQTSSFIDMEGPESSLSTGPMSPRSSSHLDAMDQDVSVEHHVHHESNIYGNSLIDDATGEQSSKVKDSVDSDTGSDTYNDLSTARAGMNASSNRLNEILDDDDYLEHMERGVPMNRSISTPYSDDESPSKFIVEDELVELMERGERPLPGQDLAHPSEESEGLEEMNTQADPLEHGIVGSNLTTSFGAALGLATEDSNDVASTSETTTTTATVILNTTLTTSTEPQLVETAHSIALVDILSEVPEPPSIQIAEERVTSDLSGGDTPLEELLAQPALEETANSHKEQHSDVLHDLATSDLQLQHELDHQISLDVAIDDDDAWMDQDIQIAVDATPNNTAEVAESVKAPAAVLDAEIVTDSASNELHGEVHVQKSHSNIIVQEHSKQTRPSSFKIGSIVERSEPEQVGDIVEDAWGWDEQEVEVNLEIQKETPSVRSEEQSSGERSPSPGPSQGHDNEFASDPIEALFEKSDEDILFISPNMPTGSENTPSAPIAFKHFDVDDFFKDLETPTPTSSESKGTSHLVEDLFGDSAEVPETETMHLDKEAPSNPLPFIQELTIPAVSIASPFNAPEPEAEGQDYEDDSGAWDDESAWPDFAQKDVGDDKLIDEEKCGLESPTVVKELNELDLKQQDHNSSEIETDVPASIPYVPQEDPSVQEADQWVDQVATVETTEHILDHAHFHGGKDVEFQPPQNEHVQEEYATATDPWDEEIDIEDLPVAETETDPSNTDLIEASIPFLGAEVSDNDLEADAWMGDIEDLSKAPDISTALVEEQPPVSNPSILALNDAINDQTQGWGFDEDLAEEPVRDLREIVNSELSVPGVSALVTNAMSPHDRLFSDDIHHLSTVPSTLESPLSSTPPVSESILVSTTITPSLEQHVVHTEERVEEEEEDAWDNDMNIQEDTAKAHVSVDTVEPEDDEKDAWGDNVGDTPLEELAKSHELTTQKHNENSWDNGDAGLKDLEEELAMVLDSQKAEPIDPEKAPAQDNISVSSHIIHETVSQVGNLMVGNIDISTGAFDDSWGFDMDDAPQEQPSSTGHSELADQPTPTPLDPVALSKTQELPVAMKRATAQKEQQVVTAEHSEEEDGLSPWQDVSPQSVSKRSDAAMSLGSEFDSEYSVRSMDDEERTSPAPSHIHERSVDSSSSAAGHSTTKISTTMSWTDLNDDEWQDGDKDITRELLHGTEAKTTSVSITSNSASISSTVKTPIVEVQELPDLSGADSWDFDHDDLESETSSTYKDKTPLASKFDLSRHTKTPDMSERSVLQHKTPFSSVTPSPGRTFSSYQSSLAGSVPPSPARPAIAPSTSSSSLSGNLAVDPNTEVEDDSHLPLAIRQQRARLAARGKPLPPISKYKSTKDQHADKPASSEPEVPALSPRLSGATSPVISLTSPVGVKSPVIPAATVSTDQKYLSPALQKQRERLEKKRAAATVTASAPLSAARRLTVGEQSEQAVKPPSPLIAKAVLPSALNKTVSPTIAKKVETTTFESLSSSTSSSGLSSRLMDPMSPSPVEEPRHHTSPQQHESPILSSRARRSSNTPTSPVQRSSFSVTSPMPSSPLADGFVRRSRDSHRPVVASGLEPQGTDVVRTSQSEVHRHASRSSVSKTVLSSGWDNVTEDEEEPVVEEKKAARFSGASFFKSSTTSSSISSSQKEPDSVMGRSSPLMSSSLASGFYQQTVPGLDRDDGKDGSTSSKSAYGIQTTSDEDPYGPASARSRKAKSSFEGSSFDYKEDHEEGTLIGSGPSPTSTTGAKSMSHRDHHSSNSSHLGGSNSLLGDITSIMDEKKKYGGGQSSNNHKSDDHDSDNKKAVASNASSASAKVPKSSSWSFGSWVSSAVAVATESIDKAYETLDPEYGRMKARGGGSPMSSEASGGPEDHYMKKPGYVVGGSSLALGLASISTTGNNGAPVGGSGSGKSSVSMERASSDFAVSGSGSDAHAQHISHGHGHGYGSPQQASPRLTRKNVGDSR